MSIIQIRDLPTLPQKTLIYFTSSIPFTTLSQSYTYSVPDKLSTLISDLRHFALQNFPIICYDDGDMQLASKAFFIFKSMNYSTLVLYGGLKACEEEGLELVPYLNEPIPRKSDPTQINSLLLQTPQNSSFMVKVFPFSVYDVLGKDLTKEKLKKLLFSHGVCVEGEMKTLAGPAAALLALVLVYFGEELPSVYLGEWIEMEVPVRKMTANESFKTFRTFGTLYYDAEEGSVRDGLEVERREEEFKEEDVIVKCYQAPSIGPNRASVKCLYHRQTFNCGSCEIL